MRFWASTLVLGLGALGPGPCLALTVQAAPPRPDVAAHLHSSTAPAARSLPGPDDLKYSFVASGRAQTGQGFAPTNGGTTSFGFGPLRATATTTPGYSYWNDSSPIDKGNPLSLTPPRR